jgi:threonine/homoserine/homoserine lactone efflux protein
MLTLETLLGFLAVSVVITLAPGQVNLMVLGQSLAWHGVAPRALASPSAVPWV